MSEKIEAPTQLHATHPARISFARQCFAQAGAVPACPFAAALFSAREGGYLPDPPPAYPCEGIREDRNRADAVEALDKIPDAEIREAVAFPPGVLDADETPVIQQLVDSAAISCARAADFHRQLRDLFKTRGPEERPKPGERVVAACRDGSVRIAELVDGRWTEPVLLWCRIPSPVVREHK